MPGTWYYERSGQRFGPISLQQLKQLAIAGDLKPSDLLWKEGMPRPLPARSAKGLFPSAAAPKAPPPTPSPTSQAPDDTAPTREPRLQPRASGSKERPMASEAQQPMRRAQYKAIVQGLRRQIAQYVLSPTPGIPVHPLVDSIRAQYIQLQEQANGCRQHVEQLSKGKGHYQALEMRRAKRANELAAAQSRLAHLAKPLGHAAFRGFCAGEIPSQDCFKDRIALNAKIEALQMSAERLRRADRDSSLQRVKATMHRLAIAGKISLEQFKITSHDEAIGKALLVSGKENAIACQITAAVLKDVERERRVIRAASCELDAAQAALEAEKRELSAGLGLSPIKDGATFDEEIKRRNRQLRDNARDLALLETSIPERLAPIADELGTPLSGWLRQLSRMDDKVALAESLRKFDAAQTVRAFADALDSLVSRGRLGRAAGTLRSLNYRRKLIVISIGGAAALIAAIAVALKRDSSSSIAFSTATSQALPDSTHKTGDSPIPDGGQSDHLARPETHPLSMTSTVREAERSPAFEGDLRKRREPENRHNSGAEPTSVQNYVGIDDRAVSMILGETLHSYDRFGYKDVELGRTFDEINQKIPLKWYQDFSPYFLTSVPSGSEPDGWFFDADKRLVAYYKQYRGGPEDYLDKLLLVFGKTNKQVISEHKEYIDPFNGHASVQAFTTVDYTFPKVLVKIMFSKTVSERARGVETIEGTSVAVIDRDWVTNLLNDNARNKRRFIDWMLKVAESLPSAGHEIANVPLLSGAAEAYLPDRKVVVWLDDKEKKAFPSPSHVPLVRSYAYCASAGQNFRDIGGTVAGSITNPEIATTVHARFNHYSGNATTELLKQYADGNDLTKNANPPGGRGNNAVFLTPFHRLVTDLNSALLQEYFPPVGTTIATRQFSGGSQKRFEWKAKNGWKVFCYFDETVTLEKVEDKRL